MGNFVLYLAGLLISVSVFWFLLLLTDSWRLRRLRKKYNEYKDLSKWGEKARATGGIPGGIPGIKGSEITDLNATGQSKPGESGILQTAKIKSVRENSPSFRVSSEFKY